MKLFNGERLKSARLYRGYTIEELAEKMEVSKQTISLYETCKYIPPFDKLFQLSCILNFPYEYFIQPTKHAVGSGSTYFRSLLKTSKKYRTEQVIKMEHLAVLFSILREYVEFPVLNLPENIEYSSPSDAANTLREFWGLNQEPISDIIRTLEKNGIIVSMFPTPTDDIDAFSQYLSIDGQDVFLVALSENKDTAARLQFDVAHELGHIIMHPWSEDIELLSREQFKAREKDANEFAAAFLLPEFTFRKDITAYPPTLDYYINLKRKWKVSIGAMLYRSCTLDVISQNQYQYLLKIMQKKNWRTNEPLDNILTTAAPSLLRDAVDVLLVNNVFTPYEFLKELENEGLPMNSNEVEALLHLPKNMLSIQLAPDDTKIVTLKT